MTGVFNSIVSTSTYNRALCQPGLVHLGFGAFHRAHQAVYIDSLMEITGDLNWGIAAVNLRSANADQFQKTVEDIARHDGYFLKTYAFDGGVKLRRIRSHTGFADWSVARDEAESMVALKSVHAMTITVTESGYYTDQAGDLNIADAMIAAEISGARAESVYGYLRASLHTRMSATGAPLTIACCDNIRQNGKMLRRNLLAYLDACDDQELADWVVSNVAFPCSMVDRITPRSPQGLATELTDLFAKEVAAPIMAEDFTQWVLQDQAAAPMPDLSRVGVTVTADIDPYEETKIRVLNGGHTALVYLAALEGIETFDAAMRAPALNAHFEAFETEEVLPAITISLPFKKETYLEQIRQRFGNPAIGDTVARISADGMAKFPIFILPTIEGCLRQGIIPYFAIRSIASWHQFALHCAAGKVAFNYIEPSWSILKNIMGTEAFLTCYQLWGDLPKTYPVFTTVLRQEISKMEAKWPV